MCSVVFTGPFGMYGSANAFVFSRAVAVQLRLFLGLYRERDLFLSQFLTAESVLAVTILSLSFG